MKSGSALAAFGMMVGLASMSAAAQQLITRQQWNASPAITERIPPIKVGRFGNKVVVSENELTGRKRAIYLTVHHSGFKSSPAKQTAAKVKSFQKLVQGGYVIEKSAKNQEGARKETWKIFLGDIPYHFYISAQGQVAEGRELTYAAYSNTVYKTPIENHITVVLEGNFEQETPTEAQLVALTDLLFALAEKHNVSLANIGYHKMVAKTACPGKNLIALWPRIIETLNKKGLQ